VRRIPEIGALSGIFGEHVPGQTSPTAAAARSTSGGRPGLSADPVIPGRTDPAADELADALTRDLSVVAVRLITSERSARVTHTDRADKETE
jgi:hypothetical protein